MQTTTRRKQNSNTTKTNNKQSAFTHRGQWEETHKTHKNKKHTPKPKKNKMNKALWCLNSNECKPAQDKQQHQATTKTTRTKHYSASKAMNAQQYKNKTTFQQTIKRHTHKQIILCTKGNENKTQNTKTNNQDKHWNKQQTNETIFCLEDHKCKAKLNTHNNKHMKPIWSIQRTKQYSAFRAMNACRSTNNTRLNQQHTNNKQNYVLLRATNANQNKYKTICNQNTTKHENNTLLRLGNDECKSKHEVKHTSETNKQTNSVPPQRQWMQTKTNHPNKKLFFIDGHERTQKQQDEKKQLVKHT